ncbi:CAP domain-containing protein [Nonomuraea sp. NPDC003727]
MAFVVTSTLPASDAVEVGRDRVRQPVTVWIGNVASGLLVQAGPESADAPPVLWYPRWSSRDDHFRLEPIGEPDGWNGSFRIKSLQSGKCLALRFPASHQDGVRIDQQECGEHPTQHWRREPLEGGQCSADRLNCSGPVRIQNVYGRKCLDAANPNFPKPPQVGAPLQQWSCVTSSSSAWAVNQTWDFGKRIRARSTTFPTVEMQQMVDQVIRVRRDEGRCPDPSVRIDVRLSDIARAHSQDLAANYARLITAYPEGDSKRGHIGSDGTMPPDRIKSGRFTPAQKSENWALGTNLTLAQAMDGWLYHDEKSSWGHRDAILNCEYRVIGVGRALGHDNRVYWTQNFALR